MGLGLIFLKCRGVYYPPVKKASPIQGEVTFSNKTVENFKKIIPPSASLTAPFVQGSFFIYPFYKEYRNKLSVLSPRQNKPQKYILKG